MASIPEYFSPTLLFPSYSDLSGPPVPPTAAEICYGGAMWRCTEDDFTAPYEIVPAFSAEHRNNNNNNNNNNNISLVNGVIPGAQNFGGLGFDRFGEESSSPEFKQFLVMQSNQMNGETNIMKVGRYSEEERKERIGRYLKKRNQRNFNKTIKYACRKTLADRRVRVRGRFARNNELCDHHDDHRTVAEKITVDGDPTRNDKQLYGDDGLQMINYDDDYENWLQNFELCWWVNGGSTG